jgi:hypothetical protein
MSRKILGVTATGKVVSLVLLEKIDEDNFNLIDEFSLTLQAGDRAKAYGNLGQRFRDYITGKSIETICVKASAPSGSGATQALLEGAEVRGIILAAATSVCSNVVQSTTSKLSKSFGERKVKEYCADSSFWKSLNLLKLKSGMREAALFAIAQTREEG